MGDDRGHAKMAHPENAPTLIAAKPVRAGQADGPYRERVSSGASPAYWAN